MKKQCIAFDLDDTLYLEREFVQSGLKAVGRWASDNIGLSGFADVAWSLFLQGRRGDLFDEALRQSDRSADAETVRRMVAAYRMHAPEISLLTDAADALAHLRETACLALITDGAPEVQSNKLSALKLNGVFEHVILTGRWGSEYSKPHPRAFLEVQSFFGFLGNDCCYVGDNPKKDFLAPRQLGWRTVRVRRNEGLYTSATVPPGGQADVECPDLRGLDLILRDVDQVRA